MFRSLTVSVVFAFLGLQPTFAQTNWDMPTPYPEGELHTRNNYQFAEDVEKATNGALTIRIHSGNSLIKNPEIKRAVQTGQVPIGEIFLANLGPESPIFELDSIPFFAPGYDEARVLLEVSRESITEELLKQNLRPLYMVAWPSQAFFTKEPISSISDLQGLKMRTYNEQTARLAQLMGTVPTTVQATEMPQAFASGMLDAMFTAAPTAVSQSAWDYTQYVYNTQAWVPKNVVFVNERIFQSLPEEIREAVLEQAKIAEERGWQWSERENDEMPKVLEQNGMTLALISEELSVELRQIGEQMLDQWLARADDSGKKIVDDYRSKVDQ